MPMPSLFDKFRLSRKSSKQSPMKSLADNASSRIELNLNGFRSEFAGGKWVSGRLSSSSLKNIFLSSEPTKSALAWL